MGKRDSELSERIQVRVVALTDKHRNDWIVLLVYGKRRLEKNVILIEARGGDSK